MKTEIYRIGDIVRRTESGLLDRDGSIALARHLAEVALASKDAHILVDLRDAQVDISSSDLMVIAAEFVIALKDGAPKTAFIQSEHRLDDSRAEFLRACLQLRNVKAEFFDSFEGAIEWLAEVSEVEKAQ